MTNIVKMEKLVKVALEYGRDYSPLQEFRQIKGGSINEAYYVRTKNAQYFMKHHPDSPRGFFKSEAMGLRLIKESNTVLVPNYLSYSDQPNNSFLLLEWIDGNRNEQTEELLGQKLAELHKVLGPNHGFHNDTYIGILNQPNTLKANWLEYYREYRLQSQIKYGADKGLIKEERLKKLNKLLDNLDKWIPTFIEPSYLHGDLYAGNWIVGPAGQPYLVDPSFLYGDRHFEMAYTQLFHGFSEQFYAAYEEEYPLRPDFEDVKPLYQLYYLIIHLNIFGESYGEKIDQILNRYV